MKPHKRPSWSAVSCVGGDLVPPSHPNDPGTLLFAREGRLCAMRVAAGGRTRGWLSGQPRVDGRTTGRAIGSERSRSRSCRCEGLFRLRPIGMHLDDRAIQSERLDLDLDDLLFHPSIRRSCPSATCILRDTYHPLV